MLRNAPVFNRPNSFLRSPVALLLVLSPRKNTQTIAWGVGRLFIFVMMSLAEGLDLCDWINVHPVVLRLFPYSGSTLPLPFLVTLDDQMGDRVASSLDMLIQSPNVLWKNPSI